MPTREEIAHINAVLSIKRMAKIASRNGTPFSHYAKLTATWLLICLLLTTTPVFVYAKINLFSYYPFALLAIAVISVLVGKLTKYASWDGYIYEALSELQPIDKNAFQALQNQDRVWGFDAHRVLAWAESELGAVKASQLENELAKASIKLLRDQFISKNHEKK